jgi:hypothetical protein
VISKPGKSCDSLLCDYLISYILVFRVISVSMRNSRSRSSSSDNPINIG